MNSNYRKKNCLLRDVLVIKINLKKTALCLLPEAVKQDKLSIVTLVLTCTKMKSPQSSYKIQAKIFLASCCSKILKWGLSDFTSTCFRNLKN